MSKILMEEAEHKWHSRNNNNMDKFNCSRILLLLSLFACFRVKVDYPEKHPSSLGQDDELFLRNTAAWKNTALLDFSIALQHNLCFVQHIIFLLQNVDL